MTWSTVAAGTVPSRAELAAVPVYSSALASAVPVRMRASSNEAPDGLSPLVQDAVLERLRRPNRYPVLGGVDLIGALAERLGADPAEIAVADGSLSLLNYALLSHVTPGSRVVIPWRSYEAYPICVLTAGAEPVRVANRPDGGHDLEAMIAAVDDRTAAMILCSPNNPTGVALTHDDIADVLRRVPDHVLVVLDEAYLDFDDRPERPRGRELVAVHPNLLLLRTFSKAYGLAGLRVGYGLGHPDVIAATRKILPPFPVAALSVAAALAALDDDAHHDAIVAGVHAQRAVLVDLVTATGLPVCRTEANFVWLPLGRRSAELGALCADAGISTRVFDGEGVRISLGEPGLIEILREVLPKFPAS